MKPEIFQGSIKKGTDQLFVSSTRKVLTKNGSTILIGGNQVPYQIETSEIINLKRKFTRIDNNSVSVKGNFLYKISPNDEAQITFEEYEAESIQSFEQKNNHKYELGEKIYAQGGVSSSSNTNLTGEYAELGVKKVDDKGKILNLSINSPGKYIYPPENPVQVMNSHGEVIEVDFDFTESISASILQKTVSQVIYKDGQTIINFNYSLPPKVDSGDISLKKQIVYLNKGFNFGSLENAICEISFDLSPLLKIPMIPSEAVQTNTMYNQGIKILEEKILELEKRISNVENMNF